MPTCGGLGGAPLELDDDKLLELDNDELLELDGDELLELSEDELLELEDDELEGISFSLFQLLQQRQNLRR